MPITVGMALALSAAFTTPVVPAPVAPAPKAQTVREYVQQYFADIPILVEVSSCESHFRQYDTSGAVYRGVVNNQDVGVMQVNEHYHLDYSKKLGYDIYTLKGNLDYARDLYNREGTAPWSSSEPCWGKSKAAQVLAVAK